jgi:hypothetical protein
MWADIINLLCELFRRVSFLPLLEGLSLLTNLFKSTGAALQTVQIIDYSDLAVFDTFNDSYLSILDYRGTLAVTDQEPGRNSFACP